MLLIFKVFYYDEERQNGYICLYLILYCIFKLPILLEQLAGSMHIMPRQLHIILKQKRQKHLLRIPKQKEQINQE